MRQYYLSVNSDEGGIPRLLITSFAILWITFGCALVIHAQEFNPEEVEQQLIGTWVSEDDPKSHWVFTKDELSGFYDGEERFSGPYSVVSECMGEEAQERDEGMLFAPSESGADICAAIVGVSEERLTLMFIPSGRLGLFMREDESDH